MLSQDKKLRADASSGRMINIRYSRLVTAAIVTVVAIALILLAWKTKLSGKILKSRHESLDLYADASNTNCVLSVKGVDIVADIGNFYHRMNHWDVHSSLCRQAASAYSRIYEVNQRFGEMAVDTTEYKNKIRKWLGSNEQLYKEVFNQTVTAIFNKYTREEVIFNPLRAKRPISKPKISDLEYIESLVNGTRNSCDFCNYKQFTAHDVSGRLESELAYAAANTFRYDRKHQLILPRTHHPLKWTQADMLAMFELALKWIQQEYNKEMSFSYPFIMWDLLPHAGASQIHPHLQVILQPSRHPGTAESWVMAANQYYSEHKENYFNDIILIHKTLGLTVTHKSAIAIASLTPKKDNEVVIISESASTDHFQLLYCVIRAFIDDMKIYPFSMSMTIPPLHSNLQSIPAVTRIVTRGAASEIRSDISSLELFGFYNVNSDPFKLIKVIENSVQKRCS